MKEITKKDKRKEIRQFEFNSLAEFYNYITNTPFNSVFSKEYDRSSISGDKYFTGTEDFNEAVELFKHGWKEGSAKLTRKLEAKMKKMEPTVKSQQVRSVSGYQAIIPNYLAGDPLNMINKKMVPVKQKVITINKNIGYAARVPKEKIEEESIKAFQLIKKLENQGMRVNLNIVQGFDVEDMKIIVKIRIKNSTEKLNLSKMAFPMVHPSMLRRLLFRFLEVVPNVSSKYRVGYGRPVYMEDMKKYIKENEYVIPNILNKSVDEIRTLEDIKELREDR